MTGFRGVRSMGGWLLGAGLLTALLGGCKSFLDPYPPAQVISETTFDPSLGIDLSQMTVTQTGLYYQDVVVGDSMRQVNSVDTVSVGYTAWLSDATEVSTADSVALPLGLGLVIPGLDEGLIGMRVGGERKMIIPSSLAWGDVGNGTVPGGAIVVFDVVLKGIGGVTF